MLNFVLPLLKNPLTRIIADKTVGAIQHSMEKKKIIRAKEIEAEKTVSVEQVKQQEHSIKDEIFEPQNLNFENKINLQVKKFYYNDDNKFKIENMS